MKSNTLLSAVLTVLLTLISSTAFTQELPKASKYENGKWFEIQFVKFKPGREDAANKFIVDHFVPVDAELGRNIIGYEFEFGKWDQLVFFPLESPEDIAWEMTPGDEKWFAAFVKHAGGMENAGKLFREWSSMIADTETAMIRLLQ
jgi:hypothetical protein